MSASENNWPSYPFVRWPFIPFVQFLQRQQNNSIIYRNWVPERLLVSDKPASSIISQPTTNNSDVVNIFIILPCHLYHTSTYSSYFDIFFIRCCHHNRCTDFGLLCTKQICDGKSSTKSWITILLLKDSAQKGSMCVRCLATIPRFNPFSEWLCACSVSKCANVNRNDCENIFGKKWVSMWVTGTCRTEFGMQRNFFSPSAWRGGG